MATYTRTQKESASEVTTTHLATWTFTVTGSDILVSSNEFNYPIPVVKGKYSLTGDTRNKGGLTSYLYVYADYETSTSSGRTWLSGGNYNRAYQAMSNNTFYEMPNVSDNPQRQLYTSWFFNGTNPTVRTVNTYLYPTNNTDVRFTGISDYNSDTGEHTGWVNVYDSSATNKIVGTITINVPPTATVSDRVRDNSYGTYYAGKTSVYAAVSNMTAYYGGNFTDGSGGAKFEIGAQSTTIIDAQHKMYITVDTPGTFTPKVTVTDSRGQTYTKSLEPITVIEYKPSATILNLQRINANGEPEYDPDPEKPSDEGTNAIIACRFFYPTFDGMTNNLLSPVVSINGSAPTNNVEWYRSWTEAGGFSNPVTFPSYENVRPVTLYGKITDTLATDMSYEISVACNTTQGSGDADAQTLSQAFYLLSAAAGGHGLGVGMKVPTSANGHGLHVGMDANFYGNITVVNMAGVIQMFAGATAPTGWLICDGSAVSRTTYATLFAVIDTTYGVGDGSTTFNLPDLRGRVAIGAGDGTATEATTHNLGQKGGRENAITPYHNHTVTATQSGVSITGGGHSHKLRVHADTVASGTKYDRPNSWASGQAEGYTSSNVTHTHTLPAHTHTISYAGTNGNATGANMQPYLTVNYIICTGDVL